MYGDNRWHRLNLGVQMMTEAYKPPESAQTRLARQRVLVACLACVCTCEVYTNDQADDWLEKHLNQSPKCKAYYKSIAEGSLS